MNGNFTEKGFMVSLFAKKKLKEKQIVAMYDADEIRQGLEEYIANAGNDCLKQQKFTEIECQLFCQQNSKLFYREKGDLNEYLRNWHECYRRVSERL